jgi:integrase
VTVTTWQAVSPVLGYDANGRPVRKEGKARRSWKEANQDRIALGKRYEDGSMTVDSTATLGSYLQYWLDQVAPQQTGGGLSPKTFRGYRDDVNNHIVPALGTIPMHDLTTVMIQDWQTRLERDKSPHVARAASATLSSALSQAVKWGVIARNPYSGVTKVRIPKKRQVAWEPRHAAVFTSSKLAQDHPFYIGWYLMLTMGLRLGELRGLRWDAIRTEPHPKTKRPMQFLYVLHQARGDRVIPEFSSRLKTSSSRRALPIPGDLQALLERHRQQQRQWQRAAGDDWTNINVVLSNETGGSPTEGHIRSEFYRLCKSLALPRVTLHELRHTAGSLWLNAGMSLATVSRRLGHSSITITANIYMHAFDEVIASSGMTLEEMLEQSY